MRSVSSISPSFGSVENSRMQSTTLVIVFILNSLFFSLASYTKAQSLDPYSRVVDPMAICNLDATDSVPIRARAGFGGVAKFTPDKDANGDWILGSDDGAGVISHLWFTIDNTAPDADYDLKIWIDDTLMVESHPRALASLHDGLLRSPFDTTMSGGFVCDVQIPYKKNFRVTFHGNYIYYSLEWRPVADPNSIESFHPDLTGLLAAQQATAEAAYHHRASPWGWGQPSRSTFSSLGIPPNSLINFATLEGPGVINTMQFRLDSLDKREWDSVYLEAFWDGEVRPSVSVPIKDFFGSRVGHPQMRAFQMSADSLAFTAYFPMPFGARARLQLRNTSHIALSCFDSVAYQLRAVDRSKLGYFRTVYSVSNPTTFGNYHQLAHLKGRGHYIGMILCVPNPPAPYYLEGDPVFRIDSSKLNSFRCTGTEDYFNGGWYFSDSIFSLPFAGFINHITTLYRFHYLDALDFLKSIDLELEHGAHNDFNTEYRTVSFFYLHHTPFWLSADTVVQGASLHISGFGYSKNQALTLSIDGIDVNHFTSGDSGTLSLELPTGAWALGQHQIAINGELCPNLVTITAVPKVFLELDSFPLVHNWTDSIKLSGVGFKPGERIHFFLDTAQCDLTAPVFADSTTTFFAMIKIPFAPENIYHVRAVGEMGTTAATDSSIAVAPNLNYEFEDIPVTASSDCHVSWMYTGWWAPIVWSNQTVLFCFGSPSTTISFLINVPLSDTFNMKLFLTKGLRYAKYEVYLDSISLGVFDGFMRADFSLQYRSDIFDGGQHFISKGPHHIRFVNRGRDPDCVEYSIAPDNLILTPMSQYYHVPQDPLGPLAHANLTVFPNPINGTQARMSLQFGGQFRLPFDLDIHLYDVVGKDIGTLYSGSIGSQTPILIAPLPTLTAGSYYLRARALGNSGTSLLEKIIVIGH
jgi:hypothetical protein